MFLGFPEGLAAQQRSGPPCVHPTSVGKPLTLKGSPGGLPMPESLTYPCPQSAFSRGHRMWTSQCESDQSGIAPVRQEGGGGGGRGPRPGPKGGPVPGRVYGTQRLQSTPGKVAAGPAPCPLVLHPLTGFTELRTHTTSTDTSCGAPPGQRLTLTELCTSARMGVTQAAGTRGSQDQASHASKKCSDRPFDPVMKPWVSGPQHGPRPAANRALGTAQSAHCKPHLGPTGSETGLPPSSV